MTSFCSQFSGLIFSQLILINCYSGWSYSSCDTISIDRVFELKVMPVTVTHTHKYEWTFSTFRWKTKIQFLLCIYTFCSISAKGVAGTYQIVGNCRKSSNKNRNSAKNNQNPPKKQKTPKNANQIKIHRIVLHETDEMSQSFCSFLWPFWSLWFFSEFMTLFSTF